MKLIRSTKYSLLPVQVPPFWRPMKQNKTRVRLSLNEETAVRLQNKAEFLSQRLKRPLSSGDVIDAILVKMSLGNWITLRAQLREFDFEVFLNENSIGETSFTLS
jgi:hypothetical protein